MCVCHVVAVISEPTCRRFTRFPRGKVVPVEQESSPTHARFTLRDSVGTAFGAGPLSFLIVRSTPISICDCEGKVRAIALRLRLRLSGYGRHIGNATASLKPAYVYYVYDHQRHLLTTTSLQIGIVHQLLCYSVYSNGAVLHFLCCMRVIRSSHNATL